MALTVLSTLVSSSGTLLGGGVRYRQFRDGYRTGIEPVLLAAAVRAAGAQRVIEAGAGAGAALLCLAHRVPGITGLGVEADPALAGLAAQNARDNGWQDRLSFQAGRIEDIAQALPQPALADHALANPPWHDAAGSASPDPARDLAKRALPEMLDIWVTALATCLRHRGTLSLIMPPPMLPAALHALARAGCGSVELVPFWSKPGRPARFLIVQARRGGKAPLLLRPGLTLHGADGAYTPACERILRHGDALDALGV